MLPNFVQLSCNLRSPTVLAMIRARKSLYFKLLPLLYEIVIFPSEDESHSIERESEDLFARCMRTLMIRGDYKAGNHDYHQEDSVIGSLLKRLLVGENPARGLRKA